VARAVGARGKVRATDPSADMVRICEDQVKEAGFASVCCAKAEADDVGEGSWNAIVCAFGLWTVDDRPAVLRTWASSLAPHGKVGVLTFGPPDEQDPFEILARSLHELEPTMTARPSRIEASRAAIAKTFEAGGLALVRHTVLRHTVSFPTAEAFVGAIREGRTWGAILDDLGPERAGRVAARFYDQVGGPTEPLVFEPAATLAIAALPGAEVELAVRPSVVAPRLRPASHAPSERAEPWDSTKPRG
jgi:SAM-dependent methyltransferase